MNNSSLRRYEMKLFLLSISGYAWILALFFSHSSTLSIALTRRTMLNEFWMMFDTLDKAIFPPRICPLYRLSYKYSHFCLPLSYTIVYIYTLFSQFLLHSLCSKATKSTQAYNISFILATFVYVCVCARARVYAPYECESFDYSYRYCVAKSFDSCDYHRFRSVDLKE